MVSRRLAELPVSAIRDANEGSVRVGPSRPPALRRCDTSEGAEAEVTRAAAMARHARDLATGHTAYAYPDADRRAGVAAFTHASPVPGQRRSPQ